MILFSDRGTPDGYHNMHGYSGHTFKFVQSDGNYTYVQIHLRKEGGFKTFDNDTATKLAGENPDYGLQTLHEDIANGKFPTWTAYVVFSFPLCPGPTCSQILVIANNDPSASRGVPL